MAGEHVEIGLRGHCGATLRITQEGTQTLYMVRPERVYPGGELTCWSVTKIVEAPDEDGQPQAVTYTVSPDLWSCTCPWGTKQPDAKPCRHRAALAAGFRALGLLDELTDF